jgi:hypothetical protein
MRINTNIAALNSYNRLKNTQNNLSKSLERLSSTAGGAGSVSAAQSLTGDDAVFSFNVDGKDISIDLTDGGAASVTNNFTSLAAVVEGDDMTTAADAKYRKN